MQFVIDHPEIWWWAFFAAWAGNIGFAGLFWTEERLWPVHAICLLCSILFIPLSYPLVVAQIELADEPGLITAVLAMWFWIGSGYLASAHNLIKFAELSGRELIRNSTRSP